MAEDPIIIKGGSVTIDFSDTYTEEGGSGRKKYKKQGSKLVRLMVNGVEVRRLNPTDEVSIICDDNNSGGSGK